MSARTLASAVAAASLAGVAVLGASSPAVAQTYPPAPVTAATISDSTVVAGQSVTVTSGDGAFNPGATVTVTIPGTSISGTVTANARGNASFTFTLPAGTPNGRLAVVFSGALLAGTNSVSVPFTVVAAAAAGPGQGQGNTGQSTPTRARGAAALPRTGADQMVPLAITGLALVGVGAGIVVASRRRREDLPGGTA